MALFWNQLTLALGSSPPSTWKALRDWVYSHDTLKTLVDPGAAHKKVVTIASRLGHHTARAAFETLRAEIRKLGGELHHAEYNPRGGRSSSLPNVLQPQPQRTPTVQTVTARREAPTTIAPPKPKYTITLSLGDVDGLFEPMASSGDPWDDKGVRQRLQALGYLYTPLAHPEVALHAKQCWGYYKRVHKDHIRDDTTAKERLAKEAAGNLVAATLPTSGEVLAQSELPRAGSFAAVRVPGGYGVTVAAGSGLNAGDHCLHASVKSNVDAKYKFKIGDPRHKIEDAVWSDNPLMGKLPLIVTVRADSGGPQAVTDVPVLIELVDPDTLTGSLLAPDPPSKVMDYSKWPALWDENAARPSKREFHFGVIPSAWKGVVRLAKAAHAAGASDAVSRAEGWVDAWESAPPTSATWWKDEWGVAPSLPGAGVAAVKDAVRVILANAPPWELTGAGQKKYIADLIATEAAKGDLTDPQRGNASETTYGGKARSASGIEAVLEKSGAQVDGFHKKRSSQTVDYGTLALPTLPDAVKYPHALQCKTNDKGNAGVLFTPSRCGGDTYKLRARIDPDWLAAHGHIDSAGSVETGTLVVWRNVRLNRYVRRPTPAPSSYSSNLKALLEFGKGPPRQEFVGWRPNYPGDPEYRKMMIDQPLSPLCLLPGATAETGYTGANREKVGNPQSDQFKYRPLAPNTTGLEAQLKWGYCELIADTTGPEDLADPDWSNAITAGLAAITASGLLSHKRIDLTRLHMHDATSPFLINWRSFFQYNKIISDAGETATYPALNDGQDGDRFRQAEHWLCEGILEHFGGGVLPGLTVVHVPRGETWDGKALNHYPEITSGYGAVRACFIACTDGVYKADFIYPATSNAIHELGHVLALCHQPPAPASIADAHQPAITTTFTAPTGDQCVCVMSYSGCYGEFCGGCILSLRGWASAHVNTL